MSNTRTQDIALDYVRSGIGKRRFIYWLGGVRSGKSYGATQCFVEHAFENATKDSSKLYLVLGYTSPQVLQIYSGYFKQIAKQEGLKCELSRATYDPSVILRDEDIGAEAKFIFRGADSKSKASTIQGLTIHGLLCDEVANLNRETLHQAEARISEPGALRVYTSNKTTPYHWSRKYYVDRIREHAINGIVLDAETRDNKNVSDDYIDEREAEYEGDTLDRFIHNKFTLDDEPLYSIPTISKADLHDNNKLATFYNLFLYHHDRGQEVVKTVYDITNQRTVILLGQSLTNSEVLQVDTGETCTLWVNSGRHYAIKELRKAGAMVRCYSPRHEDWKTQVIQESINRNRLVILDSADGLIEAVQLYNSPGYSDHPIINALEGTADMLRANLRLSTTTT